MAQIQEGVDAKGAQAEEKGDKAMDDEAEKMIAEAEDRGTKSWKNSIFFWSTSLWSHSVFYSWTARSFSLTSAKLWRPFITIFM